MKKILFVFMILSCIATKAKAQASTAQAQAIFVYNFTRLIEWPNKEGDFVIGNMGSADFGACLEKFTAGKRVGSQKIVIKKYNDIGDISACNIIIVSSNRTSKLPEILDKIGRSHTLIVTEKRGAIDMGSGINFVLNDDRLKFELKSSNVSKYGLKVSSQLESMAIVVH